MFEQGINRRALLKAACGGLAAAAVGGSLTGCSGGGDAPGDRPNVDLSKKIELSEPIAGRPYPDPYIGPRAYDRKPFGDGKTTFKVVVRQDPTGAGDWNTNEFSKWLEARTGVKIDYQAVNITGPDGGTDLSKINAMLASGDLPDAFLGIPLTQAQIAAYGEQGLFVDQTDLVEVYAPVQRQMLTEFPSLKQTTTARNGRRYQLTGMNACYHCDTQSSKAFANQKYLDQIGAKMPETTEDFRDVLKELKARNPSGKEGFLPFIGGNPAWDGMDVWFVNPFTYNPGEPWLRLTNGKVEFVPQLPEWRQAMAYMRSLYDDGTLTKQSLTIKTDEMVKLGDQGLIGIARCFAWGAFVSVDYQPGARWMDYKPVMPLKGPSGTGIASTTYYVRPQISLLITSKCQSPETLMQWGDYQLDLEATLRAYDFGGERGKAWDWADQGGKGIDGRQAIYKMMKESEEKPVGRGWNQWSLMYRSLDFRNGQQIDPDNPSFESTLYEVSKEYSAYWQPKDRQLPPLLFDESTTTQVSDMATTIKNHVLTSYAKFATAGLDINDDKVWDAYVAEFKKMNVNQYLELYQKAYDERPR